MRGRALKVETRAVRLESGCAEVLDMVNTDVELDIFLTGLNVEGRR